MYFLSETHDNEFISVGNLIFSKMKPLGKNG